MKTTIDLLREILLRAKLAAAQKKAALKQLVLSGLQTVLSPRTSKHLASDLADALANGHNTQPVGRLGRDEIYGRPAVYLRVGR